MVRAVLAATVAAAILAPWAFWDPPDRTATRPVGEERPDRVFATTHKDHLPFGMPKNHMCDCNAGIAALLVQDDALWLGANYLGSPRRIPRDGREWATLESVVQWEGLQNVRDFQVAVHDDARYEDLLTALLVTRSLGVHPRVIQPALPSFPNHGWQGGMEF